MLHGSLLSRMETLTWFISLIDTLAQKHFPTESPLPPSSPFSVRYFKETCKFIFSISSLKVRPNKKVSQEQSRDCQKALIRIRDVLLRCISGRVENAVRLRWGANTNPHIKANIVLQICCVPISLKFIFVTTKNIAESVEFSTIYIQLRGHFSLFVTSNPHNSKLIITVKKKKIKPKKKHKLW